MNKGKALSHEARARIMTLLDQKRTHAEVADIMQVHKRTVANMSKAKKDLVVVNDGLGEQRTLGVPEPKQQGGYRWSRLNTEEQELCVRLAMEYPQATIYQLKAKLEARGLTVSESTLSRILHASGITHVRAKFIDPTAAGSLSTRAINDEFDSFVQEQLKSKSSVASGDDLGALNPYRLFFMDETLVSLNETQRKGWGSKEHPPEVFKTKGNTETIMIYAGFGLVLPVDVATATSTPPLRDTDPRGNDMMRQKDGTWSSTQPQFALVWWLKPPKHKASVLPRFLTTEDVTDDHFLLFDPAHLNVYNPTNCNPQQDLASCGFFTPHAQAPQLASFLQPLSPTIQLDTLRSICWLNNIETRHVDEEGNLIKEGNATVRSTRDELLTLFQNLQTLVRVGLGLDTHAIAPRNIPRNYYEQHGRNRRGGQYKSQRGDQVNFIQYIMHVTNHYQRHFPNARPELRMAWDNASTHGRVGMNNRAQSYIHQWVQTNLGIKGAVFLPVKKPDYNPVELLFAYVKAQIRIQQKSFLGEISVTEMIKLIDISMGQVTKPMIEGWIRYGCYNIPGDSTALSQKCLARDAGTPNVLKHALDKWLASNPHTNIAAFLDAIDDVHDQHNIALAKQAMRRYDTLDRLFQDLHPSQVLYKETVYNTSPDVALDLTDTFLVTMPCVSPDKTYSSIRLDKSNILHVMFDNFSYHCAMVPSNLQATLRIDKNVVHVLGPPPHTAVQLGDKVFELESACHMKNYAFAAYETLVDILDKCQSGFECAVQLLPDTPQIAHFVQYIREYLTEQRGPLLVLNMCRPIIESIATKIDNVSYVLNEDKLQEAIFQAQFPLFQPRDTFTLDAHSTVTQLNSQSVSRPIEGDFQLQAGQYVVSDVTPQSFHVTAPNAQVQGLVVATASSTPTATPVALAQSTLPTQAVTPIVASVPVVIPVAAATSVASSVTPNVSLANTTQVTCAQQTKFVGVSFDAEKTSLVQLAKQTPYFAPHASVFDLCISLCSALMHEKKIKKKIEQLFIRKLAALKDHHLGFLNSVVLKIKRKCKECGGGSEFSYYPLFDVENLRQKYEAEVIIKMRSLNKGNERRWPGYPLLPAEVLSTYKVRATPPDFQVQENNGTLTTKALKRVDIDPNSMQLTVVYENDAMDNMSTSEFEQKFKNQDENLLMYELAKSRIKEYEEKVKKILKFQKK